MKAIYIREIPDEVHKQFKIHCVQTEHTQQELILRLIKAEIKGFTVTKPQNEKQI